ncbi:hybrid sensor histidine kinase/response regulator [Phreatobacter cathodiphilus]|uniref:histidine kinase n=2 Tax=Phreatobacter cathodiphilus TaxID=1868589 RepID=A0A2S0NFQ5_9HYPH|nr:hybrid sensor histidine kinase/response regulator [Phreatobacter cathodiphilus]
MVRDEVLAPGGRFDTGVLGRLFDAMPMRVTAADAEGRFVYANRAALAMFDLSLDQVVGRTVREILGEDMAARTTPLIATLAGGEPVQWSDWVTYANGARRHVEQVYAPCFDRGGGLVGFIALIRDTTALKEREEALEARLAALNVAEAINTAIIKTSIDPIMVVDEEGVLIDLNPAAMATFGYSRSNSVGRPISELIIPPSLRQAHAEGMARYTASGISRVLDQRLTLEAQRADGSVIPIELTISEIRLPQRRVFTAHLRDLSQAREAERQMEQQRERLHQAEKLSAMGSLLAGVAHELNNPLAILVAQSTLLMETASDAGQKRRAERIHAAADRAGRIVKSFLAMARQRPEKRETTQLNDLVRSAADMLAYGLRSHDVTLDLDLDPNLPVIVADQDFIGQVVANLVINAQHALVDMEPPRVVSIATRRKNGHVRLVVSDNGPGVPDAIAGRIFDPYFTTKPAGVGTGIGLSICKSIIESHGGSIALDRSEEGGARFTVLLPAALPPAPAEAPEEPARPEGLTILVVDDEADVRASLAEMLELFGHRILPAQTAREALEEGAIQAADLVFVDLRMPGIDGLKFRDRAVALNPRLADRVVIMTGDAVEGPGAIERHAGDETIPVMEKPFTLADVRRILSAFI